MAKYQYSMSTKGMWMSSSGNAILALYNKVGSGKKINIHNMSIYNNSRLGYTNGAANANAPSPMRVKIAKVSTLYDGAILTPAPMDSAATFPATINIRTDSAYTPTFVQYGPIYSMTTTALSGIYTPTTSPAWIVSEHRDANRYFICTSGAGNVATFIANTATSTTLSNIVDFSNLFVDNVVTGTNIAANTKITAIDVLAKTATLSLATTGTTAGVTVTCWKIYKVIASTATAITVDPPFTAAIATAGFLADIQEVTHTAILKQLNTSTTASYPVINIGQINRKDMASGGVFDSGMHTNQQELAVRAGENLAVFCDNINASTPIFVSADVIIQGAPNRTYTVEFYTYLTSENTAIFSIQNTVGSGQVITLENIDISEIGTTDTCYFRLVPIGSIDSETFQDSNRLITPSVMKNDSTAPALTTVLDWYTNTPILPYGVPVSYMSSASPGITTVPVGYNYLNTKDFIGPMWMSYFPEGVAFKPDNQTGMWTLGPPGTYGANLSDRLSSVKGMYAPIVIREGEGFALTSGAETAAVATINSVGVSGWGGFDFVIVFSVEDARYPTITLQNVLLNSRWRIETIPSLTGLGDNGTILVNGTADGAGFTAPNGTAVVYVNNGDGTYNITYNYTGTTPQPVRVRVRRSTTALGTAKYLPFEAKFNLTSADQGIPVVQQTDSIAK